MRATLIHNTKAGGTFRFSSERILAFSLRELLNVEVRRSRCFRMRQDGLPPRQGKG